MKKRILSILLLCYMVLTLLPTTVSAADGPMNTVPKFDVSIDVYNRTSDISIKDSRSYYIYSSVPDKLRDTWAWDKKIFIQGDKAAPHVFIDGVNIKMSPSSKGPAIELNKKASAYLYFIGKDSTLQGADGRAAIQKNRSEGQLYVLARTGTTVTCKGGYRAAGIGGSWAIRNIGDSMFNMDMYGHGVNMHFGSQSNPDYWGGTINATGGEYGAGIGAGSWGHSGHSGNTIHGGAGERLYFYSGTVNASGGRLAAGIGGGFRGRGSHIYIYGGNIDAQGGDTGAGIGGGSWTTKQDMDGINAASDIVISGGRVSARGQYNCAGIGGGQYVPARNITITGGHVSATGHYGAAIGGGRWCHGKNITITDATLNLSTIYRSNGSDAAAVGYGDIVYKPEELVTDPSIATNDQIRIGSYKGKLVQLKLEARALSRDDEYSYFWNLYETLIPDENGLIDMQLLTLPYVQNYGWAINVLEMTVIDDPCNGNHDFGWVNRQSCHVWACRNKDCQARDPAAEMSKQNGKHVPGDWGVRERRCAVCDHLLEKDTAAPVLEVLNDGERYTVEDSFVGNPGAYTFTVSDPAKSGEASSGVKSVTINGVEQKADSTYYSLPAPDGGNNDAGAEYTVVATDNAGNASTATVKIYRRHRVRVVSPDEQTTYAEAELAHNEYLVLTMKMPDGAAVRMTDKADHSEIPYDKEMGRFTVGLIDRSRTLVLEYNTEYPKAELILGRSQYFFGYNADTAEPHYLKDVSRKTDKNVYSVAVQINADVIPSHYFSSPVCYTQEELAELDKQGKIAWEKYQHPEPEPGVWIVYIPTATIDIAEYDANGSWYVYAKAENLKGTTYVSTPKLIADVEKPKAINLSTGKELETDGEYWGDLRFRVEDALPVKVWHERYPGGNIELMTPDEDGCYTIPADYDVSLHHDIFLEDACGNKTYYNDIDILWNYLEVVREKDYWDVQPAQPIRISREQDLQEELSKVNIGVFASDVTGFIPVDVSWEIPEDYDPQSPREQTFTVLGTVILEGTGARCVSGLDVITRPGEEWKKNFSISVTVEGAPRYKVTTEDSANGSVTVVNATETAENGTPLFYKDELVMLSIAPDEGYMLSRLSINGTSAAVAVGEDTYTFAQPEENVTVTATFEKRNEHTVTFDANGGSEPEDLPEEVTTAMPAKKVLHGSEYYLPECEFIAPEDQQFKAWQIDGTEYPVNAPVTVTADITVKALWENARYTITFDTAGGSEIAPITQDYGTNITAPADPTREGYTFIGWDKAIPATMPAENMTITAKWKVNSYTITFNTAGGSTVAPITQDYGTAITAPADPTREGYTFIGWDKAIPKTMPAENITIKAQWKINQYTITFDTNGGSAVAPITQDYGTAVTAPANPTKEGYTFIGWDKAIPATMPAENVTITAKWKVNQYTITFDTAGGSTVAPITQDYGMQIAAPTNPTREGYTFIGWDKAIPATMPAENVTITAKWKVNQYTITFDTAGGSTVAPITQDYGTQIAAPANPTREGYTFLGWDTEIPATMPAENVTITAKWKVNSYTITFDTAGGSTVAPITQDYGTNITAPAAPTKEGYTFIGWDKAIPATMPAENVTITAKWKVNQYTITFDTAGGSAVAPITQNYGTAITVPESPTREGYTFIGWDKTIPTTMPAENMTIKARWKDIEKPTGEIIIGTNKWSEFLNELTYGLFFKDTQTVTINASDNSGIVFVSYLVTDQDLSEAELKSLVYRAYEDPFRIEPNGEYIVYVMLVDESLNITYLRSDRITLDNIQPVISGIEDGKTYCEAQTVTINEKYTDTVTVNGTPVTLDENGSFVLSPANGKQKIVVTDKAGNTAEMTVTVNDGHTLLADDNDCTTPVYCKFCNEEVIAAKSHRFTGNWQNDETAHWHICQNENCTVTDRKTAHSGEDDGNCLTAVVCECGYVITAAKPAHIFYKWASNGNGTHTRKCTVVGCNGIETDDCSGGKATCTEQAICTVCHTGYGDALGHNFTIAQHDETHHWNKCSRCDATDTKAVHTGGTATCREKAVCEVCRSAYGKLSAANHVGGTEIRDAKPQSCTENGYTGDTYCKGCGEKLSSGTIINADGHKGGTATCTDKAECEICHEKYGEPDANHHTGMEMVDAVPATAASTGTAAHWRCTACGKLFADADGKQEIRSEDTVTKKLAPSILDGANSEWRKGDENGLTFSSDAAFSDFVEVLVDGKTVASENYERREGGTIVELKASYLETLAEGEHTLTIRSASGDATTRFTIAASNSTNAWVWIIIGFIALGIGVTVAVFVVRKRKTA